MKLIILDRDGVINKDLGTYVTHPDEFVFAEGALNAIADLKRAGYLIAIATNQGGIERGLCSHEDLATIHVKMLQVIRQAGGDIDRIVYCPAYDDAHPWRKPNAGMLTELLNGFGIDAGEIAEQVVFIGDAVRDMQAGAKVGCRLIKVNDRHGNDNRDKMSVALSEQVVFADDLAQAVKQISAWEKKQCY